MYAPPSGAPEGSSPDHAGSTYRKGGCAHDDDVLAGQPAHGGGNRPSPLDARPGCLAILAAADELREENVDDTATYVRNQNISVTNLCVNACGFSRKSGDADAFFYDEAVVREKAWSSTLDLYSWIRNEARGVHIHANSPMEVAYAAEKSGISTGEVPDMTLDAGLSTLCPSSRLIAGLPGICLEKL